MLKKLKKLQNNKVFIQYLNNTSWLMAEKLLKLGLGFVVLALLVRHLGPKGFGLLAYAQSFVGVFVAFTTLGLEVILVRELTKHKAENNKILGTGLILKVIASIFAIFVVLTISKYIDDQDVRVLTNIVSFTLLFQSLNLGLDTYFQANIKSKKTAISNTVAFILSSIVKIILVYINAKVIYFAYALVFDGLIITLAYIYIYTKQEHSIFSLAFDKAIATSFIKNGWPMMVVAMAVFVYTRVDQIMILHMVGSEAVGFFAAALRVSELCYFIPLFIAQSVFPKIVQLKEQGNIDEYFRFLENLYKLVLWISIPITISVILFSDLIVKILYGSMFNESIKILSVLAFCLIFISIGSVSAKLFYVEGFERKYMKRSLLGMLINIGLNFIFISAFGAIGAAYSTLITLFFIHYIYDLFDKEIRKYYYLKLICFIPKL
jgi:O-antigen/teichoic acid export membrane protein